MCSIMPNISNYRVSSILNGDRKVYGKKFLFDGNNETCWNSDKGSFQWIEVSFKEPQVVKGIKIQFQGGFSSKILEFEEVKTVGDNERDTDKSNEDENSISSQLVKFTFHPLDTNQIQEFYLDNPYKVQAFRLVFRSSFDFYGRITIYNLDLLGG